VKRGAVVSTRYTTLNFLRTIEEVLGLPEINAQKGLPPMMNLNDALARPMADIFDTTPGAWNFTASPSAMLYNTSLPLAPQPAGMMVPRPPHDASYWARTTKGMNLSDADVVDERFRPTGPISPNRPTRSLPVTSRLREGFFSITTLSRPPARCWVRRP